MEKRLRQRVAVQLRSPDSRPAYTLEDVSDIFIRSKDNAHFGVKKQTQTGNVFPASTLTLPTFSDKASNSPISMKPIRLRFLFALSLALPELGLGQSTSPVVITSPDKAIVVTVSNPATTETDKGLQYQITAFGQTAVASSWLGVSTRDSSYMDRDDQEMVNFYHRVMESAARHKLTIEFHGAYKPTGLRRTYLNLVTTEAVLNLEFLKWSDRCTPQHNVNTAFVRMLAGPLDYHLGGFNSVTRQTFVARKHHPMVMGTRVHILGMYVVYETYLQLLCDAPEAYIDQPGFDFLLNVPVTWDETNVLNAKVGEYILIARRSRNNWFIGGLNNATPREVDIPLSFLQTGTYSLEQYTDAPDATEEPNHVEYAKKQVSSGGVRLAGGGGLAMTVKPVKK